jgi:hypothetical protein
MRISSSAAVAGACALALAIADPSWAQGFSPLPAAPPAPATPAQTTAVQPAQPPAGSQGMTMGCGMMRMGGMNANGMNMSAPGANGMGMNMGQNAVTDMAQNVSMRDILQVVLDMARLQERMLDAMPGKQAPGMRRDLERIKDTTSQLMGEIKGMINAAARGQ